MTLHSSAFADGASIPARYTADGENVSPPLAWKDAPASTRTFALLADDPDALSGDWVHWAIYNIPADSSALSDGIPPLSQPLPGVKQGVNDFHKIGYGGPSPPRGLHHYVFTLYALDSELPLPAGATKRQLTAAMQDHILAECRLTGTYRR
jgi:Raf kinase inhibitor-like YbhB/YbcL family protein